MSRRDDVDEWEAPVGLPSGRLAGRGDWRGPYRRGDDGPAGDPSGRPGPKPPAPQGPATHYRFEAGQHAGCPMERWWHVHPVEEVDGRGQ